MRLDVAAATEAVTVTAGSATVESKQNRRTARQNAAPPQAPPPPPIPAPSQNVTDFQKRVNGVLPIAVNVPRTGASYRFVRPLVVDEQTELTFRYRSGVSSR